MYTKRHHAFNLLKYLSNPNINTCSDCPAPNEINVCKVCATFIYNPYGKYTVTCPCNQKYGFESEEKDREYQIKMTWLKIEEILGEIK